jgi:hypothetical protein
LVRYFADLARLRIEDSKREENKRADVERQAVLRQQQEEERRKQAHAEADAEANAQGVTGFMGGRRPGPVECRASPMRILLAD